MKTRNSLIKQAHGTWKVMRFLGLICFLWLSYLPSSIAQDSVAVFKKSRFSIGLEAGYMASLVSGDAKKGIDDVIEGFAESENENLSFEGKTNPKLSPTFGIFFDYKVKEKLGVRLGARINIRGYDLKIEGQENHPEYQFDHKFIYEETYDLTTLEIPLSVSYIPGNRVSFGAGLLVGFGLENSSELRAEMVQDIIINGETSVESSEEIFKLSDSPSNPFFGGFVIIDYRLFSSLFIGASAQTIQNYAEIDHGKLSDLSFSLSLKYLIPVF